MCENILHKNNQSVGFVFEKVFIMSNNSYSYCIDITAVSLRQHLSKKKKILES